MAIEDEYLGIVAICGDEGTGKTTMALTFPKPLVHFDVDVGGYRRAAWRLDNSGITSRSYPKPIQLQKLLGQTGTPSTRITVPKKVEGMKELWQSIAQDFVDACLNKDVRSIVIDSSTLFWNICHSSHLQELQERQVVQWSKTHPRIPFDENDYRERLQPVEYGPANDKMRTVLHTARTYQKNLVLTHYPTDEYGVVPDGKGNMVEGKTGKVIMDGFKETAKMSDLIIWVSIKEVSHEKTKEKSAVGKITKCGIAGMGLDAVGLEIPATFDGVINLRNLMAGGSS